MYNSMTYPNYLQYILNCVLLFLPAKVMWNVETKAEGFPDKIGKIHHPQMGVTFLWYDLLFFFFSPSRLPHPEICSGIPSSFDTNVE